ncbi:protein modifying enzyme [Lithospermum erythrorhizon]|uniref:Protein modifying enzyme n=1 Tax=Lithospermum erythrorhizon TaxID=34254 RepID=A0AAV3NSR4_LITER
METTFVLSCSNLPPVIFSTSQQNLFSFRHFNKHLNCKQYSNNFTTKRLNLSLSTNSSFKSLSFSEVPIKKFPFLCRSSASFASAGQETESLLTKGLSFPSFDDLKSGFLSLTPFKVCKWGFVFAIALAVSKWSFNLVFNPFFWMYFSWTWMFWPWMLTIGLGLYGFYCYKKHLHGEANVFEQLVVVTSAFTWLTLVPPAHFNGFLEGWPFVFFLVYHYFFFFNVSVRKRLYGDYYVKEHDAKWDVSLPNWQKLLFCFGVMVCHWLAAFEGPELHLVPGGWSNLGIWVMIIVTLLMQYKSTLYLAKYSEKVVVPTAVVQFGPYRFVRHPIYASMILLFGTYFTALRAPLSLLFVVAVCCLYYGEKAKVEEALMLETFGERYTEYMTKVKYKLVPFVY